MKGCHNCKYVKRDGTCFVCTAKGRIGNPVVEGYVYSKEIPFFCPRKEEFEMQLKLSQL